MTPRALKAWRLRLDLSQEGLARWLGVSRCTVNRWEGGLAPIPKMVALLEGYRDGWVVDEGDPCDECGNPFDDAEGTTCQTCQDWVVTDPDRRVHVGHRRRAGDRRVNRFSPADY